MKLYKINLINQWSEKAFCVALVYFENAKQVTISLRLLIIVGEIFVRPSYLFRMLFRQKCLFNSRILWARTSKDLHSRRTSTFFRKKLSLTTVVKFQQKFILPHSLTSNEYLSHTPGKFSYNPSKYWATTLVTTFVNG